MKALSFATVFAALSGFVLMLIAARALGDIRSAELMACWGLFFACTGFIDGLMQETTRAVAASTSDTENAARPASVGTLIAIGIGALALVVTPFVVTYLLSSDYPLAVGLFVVGLISYTYQAVLSGVLSGLGLWRQYAGLVALDSGIRFVLVVCAWVLGWCLRNVPLRQCWLPARPRPWSLGSLRR